MTKQKNIKEERYKLLTDFANDLTIARDIKVVVSPYHKSFKPRSANIPARYEDANMIASLLTGAESFLNYLHREKYFIVHKRANK